MSDALERLGAHMDDAERAILLAAMRTRELAAGDVIVRDGEAFDALHVVTQGELALSVEVDGKPLALGKVGPGEWIGQLALVDRALSHARASAAATTRILTLDRDAFDALRREHVRVASLLLRAIVEDLAVRVREANTSTPSGEPSKRGFFASAFARLLGGRA